MSEVARGDVLHFITWGGGGWGDPLDRDPEIVALEVRRGLVSVEGAADGYGVVCTAKGEVDGTATEARRNAIRSERGELQTFDMGPSIPEILERCEAETGLPAPRPPVNVRKAVRA